MNSGEGMGPRLQTSHHGFHFLGSSSCSIQEPTQSRLVRTEVTPITQEITRVLEGLCPETPESNIRILSIISQESKLTETPRAVLGWGGVATKRISNKTLDSL